MIILHYIKFKNWFSYGPVESIVDFSGQTLTQVVGENGTGKSSIPLIIEETLYGKNSKGIKKQDLVNRKSPKKGLQSEIVFSKGDEKYKVILNRKSTVSLSLYKGSEDISSHTSSGTFDTIEAIIGLDFKMFSQLFYQSSTSNLQFLTATDANRKKFLISLFRLESYLEVCDEIKKILKDNHKNVSELDGAIANTKKWLQNTRKTDLIDKEFVEVPAPVEEEKVNKLAKLVANLGDVDKINKKVSQNNLYKQRVDSVSMEDLEWNTETPQQREIDKANERKVAAETKNALVDKNLKKIIALKGKKTCPVCDNKLSIEKVNAIISDSAEEMRVLNLEVASATNSIKSLSKELTKYNKHLKIVREFEDNLRQIDNSLASAFLNKDEIQTEMQELRTEIGIIRKAIVTANETNNKVEHHNAKIKILNEQIKEYEKQLRIDRELQIKVANKVRILELLKNVFSPSGLVSYKIEYLVNDLETTINEYLAEFSKGRFQIMFNIKDDKLNIVITDNGREIGVDSLSAGELGRVNVSTLLAIRKVMSELSETRINLLFLDEIMGVLDTSGKDTLIEILLREQELNTFIVSHEWEHPLVPKITIIKENEISRIEV